LLELRRFAPAILQKTIRQKSVPAKTSGAERR